MNFIESYKNKLYLIWVMVLGVLVIVLTTFILKIHNLEFNTMFVYLLGAGWISMMVTGIQLLRKYVISRKKGLMSKKQHLIFGICFCVVCLLFWILAYLKINEYFPGFELSKVRIKGLVFVGAGVLAGFFLAYAISPVISKIDNDEFGKK